MSPPLAQLGLGWALFWVLLAVYLAFRQLVNLYRAPRLRQGDDYPLPSPPPLVSVLIPARNEADRIGRAVGSVLSQDYPSLELIVIDDASTDGTAQAAQRAIGGDGRARVICLREEERQRTIPGKAFALARGEEVARGKYLLLMDADVVLAPTAVGLAVGYLESLRQMRPKTALLSLAPRQTCRGTLLEALQVGVYQLLDGLMDYRRNNSSRAREPVVSGAFILVLRSALNEIGGHRSLKVPVLVDTELARLLRRWGYLIHFARGEELVGVEMYRYLSEALAGWRKNLWACLGWKAGRILARCAVVALLWLSPALLVVASLAGVGVGLSLALSLLTLQLSLDGLIRLARGHSPLPALLSPLVGVGLVYLALAGLLDQKFGRGVRWKGRKVGG